jgi:hypothetical protein
MDQTIPMWAFYLLLALLAALVYYHLTKTIADEKSPIEWWHFVSTKGKDGEHYADITKLGQVAGIVVVSWLVIAMSARVDKLDALGFCGVLALALAYLAGVQAFQAYLKSRQDPK